MQHDDLQRLLDEAVAAAGAPGAGLAVLDGDRIDAVASGFANACDGIPATPQTVFQVGSITKAFTATLAMQLVDQGLFTLDRTLAELLPDLRTARSDIADQVRLRELLCHTAGLDGDMIVDTGEADDYLEKFVTLCDGIDFVHPPGAFFSYCNAGYILLGRALEVALGLSFDKILKERLLAPLELTSAETLLDRFPEGRLARGHARDGAGWTLIDHWPRSNTPSGSRLALSPRDLAAFARLHIAASSDGSPVLSAAAARAMRESAVVTPYSLRNRAWGLGWMRFDWDGADLFGHDGGVAGTASFLRVAPEARFAVALCVNGPDYAVVYEKIMRAVLGARLKIEAPPAKPVPDHTIAYDPAKLIGRYERHGLFAEIRREDEGLFVCNGGEFGDPNEPVTKLLPIAPDLFVTRLPGATADTPLAFFEPDAQGRPAYVHFFDRAYRRVSP